MSELAEALESLATLLEAEKHPVRDAALIALLLLAQKKKLARTLTVSAFKGVDAYGKLIDPVPVEPGDDLYLSRPHEPAAGTLSRNTAGRLYSTALGTLAAGKIAEMQTALYEKRWIVDGKPCDVCIENGDAGWIPADEDFPSGDEEPLAHPNCMCEVEVRRAEAD
jgi:hypothetical protein